MKAVTVVDLLNKDKSHLIFNRFFLKSLLEGNEEVEFFGNRCHLKNINVDSRKLNLKPVKKLSNIWFLQLIFIFLNFAFRFKYRKVIIIAQDNYFTPLFFLLMFPLFLRTQKIIFFHNNLDNLIFKKKRILFEIYMFFFNPKILCLTQFSCREAKCVLDYKNIVFLPHPSYKIEVFKEKPQFQFDSNKINIIVLGRQAKNFEKKYTDLINSLKLQNVIFHVFSETQSEKTSENINRYDFRPDSKLFNYLFQNADYTFFSSSNNIYRASGLLMDSISRKCPIIAPINGHFNEFRDSNIGFFYDTKENFISSLNSIDNLGINRSFFKMKNFEEIIEETNFQNISKKFLSIL